MANRKALLIGVVSVVLIFLGGMYLLNFSSNRGPKRQTPQDAAALGVDIGVIDMNQAMRAHPEYATLMQLKKERNALAADAEDRQALHVNDVVPAADLSALDSNARLIRNQKLAVKQAELNARLKKKDNALRVQFSGAHEAELKEIDDLYLPQIFNLQLKLDTLRVDKEAAEEIFGRIHVLKREHSERVRDNQDKFMKQIAALMQAEQAKALQELQAYAAGLDQEIGAAVRKQQAQIETRDHLAMAKNSNEIRLGLKDGADLRRKLADHEQNFAALEEAMRKDISSKVAKIAVEHKLTMVLTGVKVNVNALDITDLVIEAFKK